MDGCDDQVLDIDEARIIISLKNDEINNMKSSIKANQIRTNLKLADFQYKIQNLQNKLTMSETKVLKSEQNLKKQKQKHQQQLLKLHGQNEKLKELIEQAVNQSKQKQRQFKGALYEQKIKLQKQRQMNYKWACQFQIISKYFDPKKVLALLEKEKLQDIPTYVDLYKKYTDSQEIIKHSNLQLSNMRSQIMSQMQESFQKLSSYESVMWDLKVKNQQLRNQIQQKQNELILRSQEINQKKSLLEAVQVEASSQIEQLSSELIHLQKQFENHNREDDNIRARSRSDTFYIQKIDHMQQNNWEKQAQYIQQLTDYEQRIVKLEQENRNLRMQVQELEQKLALAEELNTITTNNYQKEIQDERKVVALLQISLKNQEEYAEELKRQYEIAVKELHQLMISKRKLAQQYKLLEEEYRSHFISLNQEIDQLRVQLNNKDNSENNSELNYRHQVLEINNQSRSQRESKILKRMMSGQGSIYNLGKSTNLLHDINEKLQLNGEQLRSNADFGHYEQDPSWPQKYYSLLQKHNNFIKQVFSRLKGIKQKQA